MKSDVMPSRVQMEAGELKTLLNEVKETVANVADLKKMEPAKFNAVNMWNIRRTSRSASVMRNRQAL